MNKENIKVGKILVNNEEETLNFAKEIISSLDKNDIVILTGDLGTGKTKFVEGIMRVLGGSEDVSSPTFTIVNEYYTKNEVFKKINHLDVYRLESPEEIFDAGIDECFGNGLSLIEWGEMIEELISGEYLKLTFEKIDTSTKRQITIEVKENN